MTKPIMVVLIVLGLVISAGCTGNPSGDLPAGSDLTAPTTQVTTPPPLMRHLALTGLPTPRVTDDVEVQHPVPPSTILYVMQFP
jgi:hypothetical protein